MNKKLFIMCFAMLCCMTLQSAAALPWDNPVTYDWWMRDDAHTVNGYLGYVLNVSRSYSAKSVSLSDSGDTVAYFGLDTLLVKADNSTSALGSIIILSRIANGTGFQNVTFTPDQTVLDIGRDAIQVDLYIRIGYFGEWVKKATFISSKINSDLLHNSSWTYRLWTERSCSSNVTTGIFRWGSADYESRVEDLKFDKLTPWQQQDAYLNQGDFFQFLAAPWTYYIGDLFWAFLFLFVAVTTYNQYGDIRPVIVMLWLFGGTGGILGMLLPWFSMPVAWFLLSFVLGTTLYLLIR